MQNTVIYCILNIYYLRETINKAGKTSLTTNGSWDNVKTHNVKAGDK